MLAYLLLCHCMASQGSSLPFPLSLHLPSSCFSPPSLPGRCTLFSSSTPLSFYSILSLFICPFMSPLYLSTIVKPPSPSSLSHSFSFLPALKIKAILMSAIKVSNTLNETSDWTIGRMATGHCDCLLLYGSKP